MLASYDIINLKTFKLITYFNEVYGLEQQVKLIDNVNNRLKDDLQLEIKKSTKISNCFFSFFSFDFIKVGEVNINLSSSIS